MTRILLFCVVVPVLSDPTPGFVSDQAGACQTGTLVSPPYGLWLRVVAGVVEGAGTAIRVGVIAVPGRSPDAAPGSEGPVYDSPETTMAPKNVFDSRSAVPPPFW